MVELHQPQKDSNMPEELQHLLKRIRTEGVDQAEHEAEEILSQAKTKAASLVQEAKQKSQTILAEADTKAALFTERSSRALAQAGRDVLISVGNGVQQILQGLVEGEAATAMDTTFLQGLLDKVITAYVGDGGSALEVTVGPDDHAALQSYFREKFQDRLTGGSEVRVDPGLGKGFKIHFKDTHVYHDFTSEAVAEALGELLQPHLAEIVAQAAQNAATPG
jgi:V/A-type H+-transporting ATPase subunit E